MEAIRLGDRVLVRGALDPFEGVVEGAYDNGDGRRLLVRVELAPPEPGEDYTVLRSVAADQVLPFTELPPPPPRPLEEQVYARRVQAALERVAPRLPGSPRLEHAVEGYLGPGLPAATDAVLHGRAGPLLIQADPADDGFEADRLTVDLLRMMVADSHAPAGLFVTADGLTDEARRALEDDGLSWVVWRGPDDDQRLVEALTPLLERLARPATG